MCYEYDIQDSGYITPKMTRFKESEGSEFDYRKYERTFSGRMTKKRWKIIDRFCRISSRSPRYRCGHDWDCCGCQCGQNMGFEYKHNQVRIYLNFSFNY